MRRPERTSIRLVVHIDGLVLRGFRHDDHHAIAAGLESALTRLLREPGAPARLVGIGSSPRLSPITIRSAPGAGPRAIGARVGAGIARTLSP